MDDKKKKAPAADLSSKRAERIAKHRGGVMSKKPSFQFYPGDWLKDTALRLCSPAARGIWMDMLCLLHECPQRGVFRSKK